MRSHARFRVIAAWVGLASLCSAEARSEEFYYALIFGSQSHPKLFRYTHTWVTFVRAVGVGPDPNDYAVEAHTISWLPATLDIRPLALFPEQGANLDLYQSLAAVSKDHESVTMWGPFLITGPVYERSLSVRQILESGAARYRASRMTGNLLVSDCIQAVLAVDPIFGGDRRPPLRVGKPAGRHIARGDGPEGVRPVRLRQLVADPTSWT